MVVNNNKGIEYMCISNVVCPLHATFSRLSQTSKTFANYILDSYLCTEVSSDFLSLGVRHGNWYFLSSPRLTTASPPYFMTWGNTVSVLMLPQTSSLILSLHSLNSNQISDEGGRAIAAALRVNKSLTILK